MADPADNVTELMQEVKLLPSAHAAVFIQHHMMFQSEYSTSSVVSDYLADILSPHGMALSVGSDIQGTWLLS